MASARAPTAAGANDEVSECGQHCSASLAGSMISSENKTSGITVPEMPSLFESAPTGKDALWANKVFDVSILPRRAHFGGLAILIKRFT